MIYYLNKHAQITLKNNNEFNFKARLLPAL